MPKAKPLPVRTPDQVLADIPFHRQSILGGADTCLLRTKWTLETLHTAGRVAEVQASAWNTREQARGILAHRHAAEVVMSLYETGNRTMPVEESLQILYEVCEQRHVPPEDVVTLPVAERRLLRMWAVLLVHNTKTGQLRPWGMENLAMGDDGPAVEQRLWTAIPYTDADGRIVDRIITGQPDAILTDPPDGLVILDWKSSPKAPAAPKESKRDENGDFLGETVTGNVSYMGYFQQRVYALLAFAKFPQAMRVTLREVYPMDPTGMQVRTATVRREDLEHIERELGTTISILDRALAGGSKSPLWKPQPGRHCLKECPRPGSCPIPREERGEGGIQSHADAERWAAQMLTGQGIYDHRRKAVKAYHEETGRAVGVKDGKRRLEFRWGTTKTGGRSFDLFPVQEDEAPDDLAGAFEKAAARKAAA